MIRHLCFFLFFWKESSHFCTLFLLRYFHGQPSEVFSSFKAFCPYKNSLIKTEINDWVHYLKCHAFLGHVLFSLLRLGRVLETSTVRPSIRNKSSHTSRHYFF